jgi:hypothetical protein
MESAGEYCWGFAGGVYMIRAIKRVHSMRLILPSWHAQGKRAKALNPIAQKNSPSTSPATMHSAPE